MKNRTCREHQKHLQTLLLLAYNIDRVYDSQGKDLTEVFFRVLATLRGTTPRLESEDHVWDSKREECTCGYSPYHDAMFNCPNHKEFKPGIGF